MGVRTETNDWLSTFEYGNEDGPFGYLQPGYSASGELTPGDDGDLIMVPMPGDETFTFHVEGDGVSAQLMDDIEGWPFDADGSITHTVLHPSQFYFVKVTGSGAYTVSMEGTPADYAPDEETMTFEALEYLPLYFPGSVVTGVINGNEQTPDVDYYGGHLIAGETYRWEVYPATSDYGAVSGAAMTVYDDQGVDGSYFDSYFFSAWGGGENWLEFTPDVSGIYAVGVTPYADFNNSGSYTIAFKEVGDSSTPAPDLPVVAITDTQLVETESGTWAADLTITRTGGSQAEAAGGSIVSMFHDPAAAARETRTDFEIAANESAVTVRVDLGTTGDLASVENVVFRVTQMFDVMLSQAASFSNLSMAPTQPVLGTDDGDSMTGSSGNDSIDAGGGDDTVSGGDGHDRVMAGAGADNVSGGRGDDTLDGGEGQDSLRGGIGEDALYGGEGDDELRGQRHGDLLDGGAGDDNVKGGGGNDTLLGGEGDDFLNGGTRSDSIDGGAGNDKLIGRSFADTLIGGEGDDRLNAGGGADRLEGGAGNDFLKGGSEADVFVFDLGCDSDRLADFDVAEDRLEVSVAMAAGRSAADIAGLAQEVGKDVVLDFGDGDVLRLLNPGDLTGLADQIDIV